MHLLGIFTATVRAIASWLRKIRATVKATAAAENAAAAATALYTGLSGNSL